MLYRMFLLSPGQEVKFFCSSCQHKRLMSYFLGKGIWIICHNCEFSSIFFWSMQLFLSVYVSPVFLVLSTYVAINHLIYFPLIWLPHSLFSVWRLASRCVVRMSTLFRAGVGRWMTCWWSFVSWSMPVRSPQPAESQQSSHASLTHDRIKKTKWVMSYISISMWSLSFIIQDFPYSDTYVRYIYTFQIASIFLVSGCQIPTYFFLYF